MGGPDHDRMSVEAFLDWIGTQDEPHELVDGLILPMMAGARQSHSVVTSNILVALAPQARRRGCRTTSSETAVRTGLFGVRYPDVVVDCGPPDAGAMEAGQPTLVVEVSSPGTSTIDTTDKLDEYRAHPQIRIIIFVDADIVSMKLYRRDAQGVWQVEKYDTLDAVVELSEIGASLSLRDVYDSLEPKDRSRLRIVR